MQNSQIETICLGCQITFKIWPYEAKYGRRFCSRNCLFENRSKIAECNVRDRFFQNILMNDEGDWVWIGKGKNHGGYASFSYKHKNYWAHRFSYEMLKEKIPQNLTLDHLCRNTSCVNPNHLEPVTIRENTLRGISPAAKNAKKDHCLRGHPLSGSNLYIDPVGQRKCKVCKTNNRRSFLENHPHYSRDYYRQKIGRVKIRAS